MQRHQTEKWLVKASQFGEEEIAAVKVISKQLGLCVPTAQLLVNRGCRSVEEAQSFITKSEEQLHDPFLMKDMNKAASHLLKTVKEGKRIVIYGDYDVDGVTSLSILYLYLKSLGANVGYYIPSRLGEGYGMSEGPLKTIRSEGTELIVTVDTGITAFEEAEIIKNLGMELIVTDHHECHTELPDAVAVVNPKQPECTYPFKELAGVGVVFKLLCALQYLTKPAEGLMGATLEIADKYIDLVAIGTIADVMPLVDENRLIVARGLNIIEKNPRVSLDALIKAAGGDSKPYQKRKITSGFIGFTIAPRINAAGRIQNASQAVELFLTENPELAEKRANELCDINKQRQAEENVIIEQAFAKIDAEHDFEHDPVIVLSDEGWHHGIIGIVASRITEKYMCPCILISFDEVGDGSGKPDGDDENVGKGSGRSVKGMNLVNALSHCADLLVKFGGHELAAGLSIKRGNLEEFKQRINDYARGCFDEEQTVHYIEAECELSPIDVTMTQAIELYKLEPFGVSNAIPVFYMERMEVNHVSSVGGGKHTKLILKKDNLVITAMYFRKSPAELDIYPGDFIDITFNLDINEYQNTKTLQFIVKSARLTEDISAKEAAEHALYASINDGTCDVHELSSEEISSIIPTRDDFSSVYTLLKREIHSSHTLFSMRALSKLVNNSGANMRYVKLKYIIRVFQELNILSIDEKDADNEVYSFSYVYVKNKADLDKSNVLRKLRSFLSR